MLLLGIPLPFCEGLTELFGLELENLGLGGASLALLLELPAQCLKLAGLDLDQLALLPGEFLPVGDLPLDGRRLPGIA